MMIIMKRMAVLDTSGLPNLCHASGLYHIGTPRRNLDESTLLQNDQHPRSLRTVSVLVKGTGVGVPNIEDLEILGSRWSKESLLGEAETIRNRLTASDKAPDLTEDEHNEGKAIPELLDIMWQAVKKEIGQLVYPEEMSPETCDQIQAQMRVVHEDRWRSSYSALSVGQGDDSALRHKTLAEGATMIIKSPSKSWRPKSSFSSLILRPPLPSGATRGKSPRVFAKEALQLC